MALPGAVYTLSMWCCRVDGPVQWGMSQGHMHGSNVDDAMSLQMVLSLGYVGLLLRVFARRGNTELLKVDVGSIGVSCTASKPVCL